MQKNDQLFQALIQTLKNLWEINETGKDEQARELISNHLQQLTSGPTQEEFDIQNKVLAKTRQKTEMLLEQLGVLEAKMKQNET
jgi:BMFP domain-containing protein YqiC